MSTGTEELDGEGSKKLGENAVTNKLPATPEELDALIEARAAEKLRDVKSKLDGAYGARDAALTKVAEFEEKERQAELKRLEEAGQHKEAFELRLAEERARNQALEQTNTELTRDSEVRRVLGSRNFKNDNALEMAYREITGQLVRNESNVWVHRSGVSIADFVKTFAESEANAFLFKAKVSSGTGKVTTKSALPDDKPQSLFALSQDEIIQRAREGKLR